ncbi:MAG: hypothetical protein HOO06_16695 [Bdellovibrionaceae bacterium]|nr:hypothetical protein [Pseudobdellovibrionaceae bacterium]
MIIFITLIASLFLFFTMYRNRTNVQWWQYMMSLGWLSLMVVPFIIQKNRFIGAAVETQQYALTMSLIAIVAGDILASFIEKNKAPITFEIKSNKFIYALSTAIVAITSLHLFLMPKIPFIEKYFYNNKQSLILREEASKLLQVPDWFIYVTQWTTLLIAPLAVLVLIKNKKYWVAALLSGFILFYSHSTTATGPLVSLIIIFAFIFFQTFPLKIPKAISFTFLLIASLFSIYTIFFNPDVSPYLNTNPTELTRFQVLKDAKVERKLSISMGDYYRMLSRRDMYNNSSWINKKLSYLYYRAILVPSEVSHRWYDYYSRNENAFIGFYGLTPETRYSKNFQHPATTVGIWAFYDRFPEQYYRSIRAYASFDADTYARWGLWGVFFASTLVFFFRIFIAIVSVKSVYSSTVLFLTLFICARSLPASSIPAMLVSNGVLLGVTTLLVFKIYLKFRNTKSPIK